MRLLGASGTRLATTEPAGETIDDRRRRPCRHGIPGGGTGTGSRCRICAAPVDAGLWIHEFFLPRGQSGKGVILHCNQKGAE